MFRRSFGCIGVSSSPLLPLHGPEEEAEPDHGGLRRDVPEAALHLVELVRNENASPCDNSGFFDGKFSALIRVVRVLSESFVLFNRWLFPINQEDVKAALVDDAKNN